MPRAAASSPPMHKGSRKPPVATARAARRASTLVLNWSLSRPAATARGLAVADGPGTPILEVRVPFRGQIKQGQVPATIIDGDSRREIAVRGSASWLHDSDLWHLDIPGLLAVSVREEQGKVTVLYARIGLLANLGLEGGRYEFEGGMLLPA